MTRTFDEPPSPPEPAPPERPRLGLTTPRQILVAALAGGALGYLVAGGIDLAGGSVPVTPWSLSVMLGVLSGATLVYARALRNRIKSRHWIESSEGVRALVLGKTLLMTGAAVAGGQVAYVLQSIGRMAAPLPHDRVVHGCVTIVVSTILAVAGHVLERACVAPHDHDDADKDAAA